MRVIEIIATQDGEHYLQFGFDQSELATFSIQLYIVKSGKRATDWLQSMSLSFCSFMGGNVWLHNSDAVPRCNLFGEQKNAKVGLVVNENPTLTKILDSIGIFTDGMWEVESVTIPADLNYPHGFYSKIPASNFKKREGVLYSEFLRNMKTSSATIKPIEALTGELLRGNEAYVLLKHTGGTATQLWKVEFNLTKSR